MLVVSSGSGSGSLAAYQQIAVLSAPVGQGPREYNVVITFTSLSTTHGILTKETQGLVTTYNQPKTSLGNTTDILEIERKMTEGSANVTISAIDSTLTSTSAAWSYVVYEVDTEEASVDLSAIADAVWTRNERLVTGTTVGDIHGDSSVLIRFLDADSNPVPLVYYSINAVGRGRADTSGLAQIGLNDGTYTVRTMPAAGVLFADVTFTVNGNTEVVVIGTTRAITPPSDPSIVVGWLVARDANNIAEPGVVFQFRIKGPIDEVGTGYSRKPISTTSSAEVGSEGLVEFEFRPDTLYEGRRGTGIGSDGTGGWYEFKTPISGTFAIRPIIGQATNS